jgi:VWFA-related protein
MRNVVSIFALCLACLTALPSARAQTAEVTTKDVPVTFKSGVNLVPVPVVVRDAAGRTIGNLGREDFELFDNGKPQMISRFTLEKLDRAGATASSKGGLTSGASTPPTNGAVPSDPGSDGIPDHFTAWLFDDLHMSSAELVYTREAAKRQLDAGPHTLDRAAIFTTSGLTMQEFTSDPDKLHAALAAIGTGRASAERNMAQTACPQVDYYMADRLINKEFQDAWVLAMQDAISCFNLAPSQYPSCTASNVAGGVICLAVDVNNPDVAQNYVRSAARAALLAGDRDAAAALNMMRNVVARMTSMPGQRSIVLISPGFLVVDDRREEESGLVERAIKASVVIGSLDSRGLYTQIAGGDASTIGRSTVTIAQKSSFLTAASIIQSDILSNLALGTGGVYYHGTNDYDEGLRRTAAPPEYLYVLGYSPSGMKLDGQYHSLKVSLVNRKGLDVQARKGFYAPTHSTDPAEQAREQIEEAFFARDDIHDLAAVLQTQFFKSDNGDVRLSATAEVDVKKLAFRKDGERNRNDLTVVTGLFDNDGNYVTGTQKVVEMRLRDETLEKRVGNGIGVKSSFAVHPGRYVVRMVVRDSEGQSIAAQSSLVEIP